MGLLMMMVMMTMIALMIVGKDHADGSNDTD